MNSPIKATYNKNTISISYDIDINQNRYTKFNDVNNYHMPEINGSFNIISKSFSNDKLIEKDLAGTYNTDIKSVSNILTGVTNDISLIMSYDDFNDLISTFDMGTSVETFFKTNSFIQS